MNKEIRQAENIVRIEGILNEVDIKESSYVRNGKTIECISGRIYIKTTEVINGESKELIIPVEMFANKYKKDSTVINSAYSSIYAVMTEMVSAAAAVEGVEPDYVRVTGTIKMNEYPSKRTGEIIAFPRITANFARKVKRDEYKPEATFAIEFVVVGCDYELDKDGNETGRYFINAAVPQYGNVVDVIPFYAVSKNTIDAVSTYWAIGDTVSAIGKLNFSQTTTLEKKTVEVDFGEPQEREYTKTTNVSDLIITGGSQTPLDGTKAYATEDIQQGLAERKARLAEAKTKVLAGGETNPKAVPGVAAPGKTVNFGF